MEFKKVTGGKKQVNLYKYQIDWDSKSLSNFQWKVKQFLKTYWRAHLVCEEMLLAGTKLRLDFFNCTKRLAIECQGAQHESFNKFFHSNSRINFVRQLDRDEIKNRWCEINNIELIKIYERDLPLSLEFFINLGIDL